VRPGSRDDLQSAKKALIELVERPTNSTLDPAALIRQHPTASLALAFAVGALATRSSLIRSFLKVGLLFGVRTAVSTLVKSR
jgi:hypothetical protein